MINIKHDIIIMRKAIDGSIIPDIVNEVKNKYQNIQTVITKEDTSRRTILIEKVKHIHNCISDNIYAVFVWTFVKVVYLYNYIIITFTLTIRAAANVVSNFVLYCVSCR